MSAHLKIVSLLALLACLVSCTCGTPRSRHQPSGFVTSFPFDDNTPFSEYVETMRRKIRQAKADRLNKLTPPQQQKILDAVSPFAWAPGPQCKREDQQTKHGVLLIHGLTDSPFMLQDIAKHFQQQCFWVRALLLPGQGTVPGDLLHIRYHEWIDAVRYGINSFAGQVDTLYLVGFSIGGTLALYHGLRPDDLNRKITAMILFSPAIRISPLALLASAHHLYSWAWPQGKWLTLAEDEDYAKYESFPLNAGYQVYKLTQELGAPDAGAVLDIPVLMVLSEDDTTVKADKTLAFFKHRTHPQSKLLLYTTQTSIDDHDDRIVRLPSARPEKNILNFSHLSIPIAPENPYYGANGRYKNCLLYVCDPEKMQACQSARAEIPLGETTKANTEQHRLLRRLTYNPDFVSMVQRIDAFLQSLAAL